MRFITKVRYIAEKEEIIEAENAREAWDIINSAHSDCEVIEVDIEAIK